MKKWMLLYSQSQVRCYRQQKVQWVILPMSCFSNYCYLKIKSTHLSVCHVRRRVYCSLLPPASAVEVIESVPSVGVCVCLFVNALKSEVFNIGTWNLVCGTSVTMTQTSSKVKVIGQRSRSRGQKTLFPGYCIKTFVYNHYGLWYDVTMSCDATKWRHDVKWRLLAERIVKYTAREVRERSGVFISLIIRWTQNISHIRQFYW